MDSVGKSQWCMVLACRSSASTPMRRRSRPVPTLRNTSLQYYAAADSVTVILDCNFTYVLISAYMHGLNQDNCLAVYIGMAVLDEDGSGAVDMEEMDTPKARQALSLFMARVAPQGYGWVAEEVARQQEMEDNLARTIALEQVYSMAFPLHTRPYLE